MNFTRFIEEYDYPGAVVLLEGKRNVAPDDVTHLIALGKLLASHSRNMKFRSGNAAGADRFFIQGIHEADTKRTEVIIPFKGHNKKSITFEDVYSLDDYDINAYPEIIRLSKGNKKTQSLMDRYLGGMRNHITNKAAFIIRDTAKVIGIGNMQPVTFGIFYDDLSVPRTGGTGHTMDICKQKSVPYIDQKVWMEWLRQ
jgi:hypothetical protein